MTRGDDEFFEWLDGELTGAQAEAVEARVRADPELSLLADEHRHLNARLRKAFKGVADAPLPERLTETALALGTAEVFNLAQERKKREARLDAPMQWFAIAASLALGLATGTLLHPATGPISSDHGKLYAAASLGQTLDRQLASSKQRGPLRIGITFRDQSGTICRSFSGDQMSGLACRERARWQLRGVVSQRRMAGGDYRMAAGADPQIASMIGSIIAGAPLDANQERSARDEGWH